MQPSLARIEKAREVTSFFYALGDDVIEVTQIMEQRNDDALSHRLYVRTAFAFIEGVVQIMKSASLIFDEINSPRLLSTEEVAVLKEEDIQLNEHGEVEVKKLKLSLLSNFQFALKTYAKVLGQSAAIDKSGEGWPALRAAIRIRDRLTHPHTLADLDVRPEELVTIEKGMQFFRESTLPLLGPRREEA